MWLFPAPREPYTRVFYRIAAILKMTPCRWVNELFSGPPSRRDATVRHTVRVQLMWLRLSGIKRNCSWNVVRVTPWHGNCQPFVRGIHRSQEFPSRMVMWGFYILFVLSLKNQRANNLIVGDLRRSCGVTVMWNEIAHGTHNIPIPAIALHWRNNGLDGVSNHQPYDCLLNRLFRRRSKKISELRVTGLCVGNSPVSGEFPAQRASNAENVSIWWRHHGVVKIIYANGSYVGDTCQGHPAKT